MSVNLSAKSITATFKLLYKPVEKYHNKSTLYSGFNSVWVIQNNKRAIDALNKRSNQKAVCPYIWFFNFIN